MACYYCDSPVNMPHNLGCPIPEIRAEEHQVEPTPIVDDPEDSWDRVTLDMEYQDPCALGFE